MSNVATIVPNRPDKEVAEEHKTKILATLKIVCDLIEAANKDGFEVTFSIQKGPMGNQFVNVLTLAKNF
jgi:hypothetical protein